MSRTTGIRLRLTMACACASAVGGGCIPRTATEAAVAVPRPLVAIEFRVKVPADTPRDARVYLTGNLPEFGVWKPHGLALSRHDDGTHRAFVVLPKGKVLEYKATLGSWRTVEKGPGGVEVPNRRLPLNVGDTVDIEVAAWANGGNSHGTSTLSGTIRVHEAFPSKILGNVRRLSVYLPPDYDADPEARYPVLYLHDGQNVFDAATSAFGVEWGADEMAETYIRDGMIHPVILVAIDNTPARIDEYTPDRDPGRNLGGRGELYARFLLDEVKPFIDGAYRTRSEREHTGIAGSSLGGLISLHIAAKHHDKVGLCGALSPALWWNGEKVLKDLDAEPDAWMKTVRFWLDMGTREGARPNSSSPELPRTRRLAARLEAAGLAPGRDFLYREIPNGEHDEAAWAARFGQVLRFFYGTGKPEPEGRRFND